MNRSLAFLFALICTFVTVSTACLAGPGDWIRFTLEPAGNGGRIHATFRDDTRGRDRTNWSSSFAPGELVGLNVGELRAGGRRPLRFAVVREAGRLDCSGAGGSLRGSGGCRFTPNPGFTQLLLSRGINRPTRDQAFALMALNVRRELVAALGATRYPTPSIDNLIELTAVGVSGGYVQELARAGYRPASLHSLVEFRALGITPQFVGGLKRIGYTRVAPDELVQLKALGITPEFIAGFNRAGYRNLPVETLIQLKALNITPEFARSVERQRGVLPSIDRLVELRVHRRR